MKTAASAQLNLAQHFGERGTVAWDQLRESIELSTIFLDDVIEANAYVPAVPQLKEAAHKARRIGLGIMGLADLMYHVGVRYGSDEGQEFSAQVMEFVRYYSMKTSIELAKQRGAFPAIKGSIYDQDSLLWKAPKPLKPYFRDWNRPAIHWDEIEAGIKQYGIRNSAQTTIAPTGTIATVAGCEGYGCEPVFALAYIRHVNDNGKDLPLTYTSPLFENSLIEAGLDENTRRHIIQTVLELGTCQGLEEVPTSIRDVFVVSADIPADDHVRTQAAIQSFVDNSLSKTINFPDTATEEEVANAYRLAWELGCKGITVYVTGSRQKVVLETNATAKQKLPIELDGVHIQEFDLEEHWHDEKKKPRPTLLPGYTFNVSTPLGKAFVTINENGGRQPFEVFINTAKAGSDTAAVSEAIGRLISLILRIPSSIAPRERLTEVKNQLDGIGGGRSLGFGPNRVRSLPDGVAHVLNEYLENTGILHTEPWKVGEIKGLLEEEIPIEMVQNELRPEPPSTKIGDLCPECGQAAVVNEEGCRKCYACGFSEC